MRVGEHLVMLITADERRYRHGDVIKLEVNEQRRTCLILRPETGSMRIRVNQPAEERSSPDSRR